MSRQTHVKKTSGIYNTFATMNATGDHITNLSDYYRVDQKVSHLVYAKPRDCFYVHLTTTHLTCVSMVSGLLAGVGNKRLLTYVN